jgi:phosphotransferase system HPr (HPr) family protein
MQTSRVTRVIVIRNSQGLHARPADMFARLTRRFESRIELVRDERRVEASSVIDLLTLGAVQGTQLVLEAEGPDAEQAVEALAQLVESGFPEEEASTTGDSLGHPPDGAR